MLRWAEEAHTADVLPRLAKMRACMQESLNLFISMFNAMDCRGAAHNCWNTTGDGRCCRNDAEVVEKMVKVCDDVLLTLVFIGNDPTFAKWFSMAGRLRGLFAGTLANELLPRAWLAEFGADAAAARARAAEDDAAVVGEDNEHDGALRGCKRVRKVDDLWKRPNLKSDLAIALQGSSCVTSFQFDVLKLDTARKDLAARRAAAAASARKRRASKSAPCIPGASSTDPLSVMQELDRLRKETT